MSPPSAIDIEGVTDTSSVVTPDPLTINDVNAKRAAAGRLVAGVAAWTSADLFKIHPGKGKPLAKDLSHLLSAESKARQPSSLKGASKYLAKEGLISLGGGLPCAEYFPFSELSIKVPSVPNFSEEQTKESGIVVNTGKYDMTEGHGIFDLSIALNYGQSTGSAQVLRWVTEHTELVCNPPYKDWQCNLTVGSTSALELAFRLVCEHGDYILAEEYTFSSAIETALPLGCKFVGVKMDADGLIPEDMDDILSNWDEKARGARKPHVLYTIPTGQNPTGATLSADRRRALYKIAQKHDIYILEDEPYYFLQMQPYTGQNAPDVPPPKSYEEFLRSLVPTLLSLDVDGRVMRLDSFSKVVAPGSRVGWVTASAQVIERFQRHSEVSVQQPSGFSQLVLYKLLDETWGHDGYMSWLIHLRLEYTKRRDAILAACENYLPTDVVKWTPPAAGMFMWLEVDHTKHPQFGKKTILELEEEIFLSGVEEGVLVSRGSWFLCERNKAPERLLFRATFAAASNEKMAEAMERFAGAVKKSFGIN